MPRDPLDRLHGAVPPRHDAKPGGARRSVGAVLLGSRRARVQDRHRRDLIRFVRRIERGVRTGATVRHAFVGSLASAPDHIGDRFRAARRAVDAGRPLPQALIECAHLAPDRQTAHVATLLAFVAGEAHGAASALASASRALQAHDDVERERRALVAQAETSAKLLVALPLVAVAFGLVTGRSAAVGLVTTTLGRVCLVIGLTLDAIGAWWMSRLIARASQ